jgi:hypothetical protein
MAKPTPHLDLVIIIYVNINFVDLSATNGQELIPELETWLHFNPSYVSIETFLWQYFPNSFFRGPRFCFEKIAMDPRIPADLNIECPVDEYPKLNIYKLFQNWF